MTQLVLPQSIDTGTAITAAEHTQNYNAIRDHVNTEMINRDGSVAFTQPQAGVTPTGDTHLTTKDYVDDAVAAVVTASVGDVKWGAWAAAPTGWLLCRGQAVSRTTYAALFAVISTNFGVGDGATTFNVPNAQARGFVGMNAGTTEVDSAGASMSTLYQGGMGEKAGYAAVPLPAHTHANDHDHAAFSTDATEGAHTHLYAVTENATASGSSGSPMIANTAANDTRLTGEGTDPQGKHSHSINVPAYSGLTGSAGTSSTFGNYQPNLALNAAIYAGV